MDVQILESKSSKAISVVQFRTAEQDTFLYKSASYVFIEKFDVGITRNERSG